MASIASVAQRKQTLVQLNDDLIALLDARASREGRSRSELIRAAIEAFIADDREALIAQQIVDGYTRIPPQEPELALARDAAARIVLEEPWERTHSAQ